MTSDVTSARDQAAGPTGAAGRAGMVIEWDVPVPMDDEHRAPRRRVPPARARPASGDPQLRPVRQGPGLPGRLPGPVAAHGQPSIPRSPGHPATGTQNWEVVDPEKWVPDGYACVRVDSRGAGRSPGLLDPFSPRETRDLYECVEWAGRAAVEHRQGRPQRHLLLRDERSGTWPRCSRRTWPRSASGRAPPTSTATPPITAASCPRSGGTGTTSRSPWSSTGSASAARAAGHRRAGGRPGNAAARPNWPRRGYRFGEQITRHPLDGEFYRAAVRATGPRSPCRCCPRPTGAARACTPGATSRASPGPPRRTSGCEVHGLEHWTHFYTDYGVDLQKRFFACFLHGDDARLAATSPPVQLQVRTLDGFIQRAEQEWPLARTQWQRLYLWPAQRALGTAPPAADERRVLPGRRRRASRSPRRR